MPVTNSGTEIPMYEPVRIARSSHRPRRRAARVPRGMATRATATSAKPASQAELRSRSPTMAVTGCFMASE